MADVEEDVTLMAHIRAEDDASDQVANVESGFQGLRSTIEDMAAGLGEAFEVTRSIIGSVAGALTAGFYSATESSLKYAEAIAKVEFLTGETAQRSAALISAFRAFGFTTDEAVMTVTRLTMRLGSIETAFKATGKVSKQQTELLKQMGLTVKDLTGAHGDLNILLPKIIDHMKSMKDPLERDRIAMQLFGRNFAALAPLVREGGAAFLKAEGDAKKFGVELSEGQVRAFETYSSAIETAKEAVQGFVLEFGVKALPYFQKAEDLIKRVAQWWHNLNPEIRASIVHFTTLGTIFGGLVGGGEVLGKIVEFASKLPVVGQLISSTLGPFAMLFSVIGPLVALFLVLQHLFMTNKEAAAIMTPVINMAKLVFKEFLDLLDIARDVFMTVFGDLMPKGKNSFLDFAKAIAGEVYNALTWLGIWFVQAKIWIAEHRDAIETWIEKIADIAGAIGRFLSDVLKPFMDQTGGLKDFILNELIPALATWVWPVISPLLMDALGWLKDHGKEVGTALKDIAIGIAVFKTLEAIAGVMTFISALRESIAVAGLLETAMSLVGIKSSATALRMVVTWIGQAASFMASRIAMVVADVAADAKILASAIAHAAQVAAAWVASGAKAVAAGVANVAKWVAQQVAMGAAGVAQAAKNTAAWIASSAKVVAMGAVNAAKWVAQQILMGATAVAQAARTVAAWLLVNGPMMIARAATLLWAAAQWLLNIALSANPIGLIVIAIAALVVGIIWAYNNIGWFRDAVNRAWASLKVLWAFIQANLLPALGTFFSWLGTTAKNVIDGVGKAFNGLGTTVHNIWSGIAATIKNYVNFIITIIDNFISGVNKITIPSWVPVVGGQHSNIPLIPHLYTGAVVTQPTLAMVGDRGTEVVATLTQAMRAGMLAAQSSGGGGLGHITIEYHVDGRLIEKRTSKITGKRMRLQGAGIGSAA